MVPLSATYPLFAFVRHFNRNYKIDRRRKHTIENMQISSTSPLAKLNRVTFLTLLAFFHYTGKR